MGYSPWGHKEWDTAEHSRERSCGGRVLVLGAHSQLLMLLTTFSFKVNLENKKPLMPGLPSCGTETSSSADSCWLV